MKKTSKFFGIILMALPFVLYDIFIRIFVGNVALDGYLGIYMPIIFDILWISLFITLCLALPKRLGKALYIILSVVFVIWTFANYIYHCIFKQFLWISDIIMAGEGSDYFSVVFDYAPLWIVVLTAVVLAINFFASSKFAPFGIGKKMLIPALICIVGIFVADAVFLKIAKNELDNGRWEIWQRPALIYNEYKDSKKSLYTSGIYQYTYKSIEKLVKSDTIDFDAEAEFAQSHLDGVAETNDMTAILKDKNIIFVLMESIDDFLISEEFTPEIKKMMDNGINFANHFAPNMGAGYTFNSEFAANTGFYCPSADSSASIYTKNSYPQTIANRLKNKGYKTAAIHFNSRQFYNREVMYKRWGYDDYYCLMDYMPIEKCVIDSDAARNEKVLDLIVPDSKFMTYFITYSAHLPYNNIDNKLKGTMEYYPDLVGNHSNEELANLRLLARDTDEFFRLLNNYLEERGIAEETAIIAYADHYAYGINDKELLLNESIAAGSSILEKTPFFIYCKGLEEKTVKKVTSTVDILPTLENMLGLGKSKILIGNDAFSDEEGLVYFSDGRWFDGVDFYNPSVPSNKDFSKTNKHIKNLQRINDFVIEYDYFKQN